MNKLSSQTPKLPNSYNPMNGKSFNEMLRSTFKSDDTEEWLDVHFTRPIGLVFALMWMKLGVHPNVVTILSIFLGMGAGYMFYFTDLTHNLLGVLLLMLANFCDSTDGQMARLTGKKTLIGRMLDGFSGDVWFFCIYLALLFRTAYLWEPWLSSLLPLSSSLSSSFPSSSSLSLSLSLRNFLSLCLCVQYRIMNQKTILVPREKLLVNYGIICQTLQKAKKNLEDVH